MPRYFAVDQATSPFLHLIGFALDRQVTNREPGGLAGGLRG